MKKLEIKKLHVVMGSLLIPLIIFYGATEIKTREILKKEKTEAEEVHRIIIAKIDTTRDSLSIRLDQVDSSLKDSIGKSENRLSIRLDQVDSLLSNKIDSLGNALKDSIYSKIDSLSR